jgi:hypothetical protein
MPGLLLRGGGGAVVVVVAWLPGLSGGPLLCCKAPCQMRSKAASMSFLRSRMMRSPSL